MPRIRTFVTTFVIVLALFSCKTSKKSNSANNGGGIELDASKFVSLVTLSQLGDASQSTALEQGDFFDSLNSSSAFYQKDPETSQSACDLVIDNQKMHAGEDVLVMKETLDLTECAQKEAQDQGDVTFELVSYKVLLQIGCESGGFALFDGSTYSDTEKKFNCKGNGSYLHSYIYEASGIYSGAEGQGKFSQKTYFFVGNDQLGSCRFTKIADNLNSTSQCSQFERTETTYEFSRSSQSSSGPQIEPAADRTIIQYSKITDQDVVGSSGDFASKPPFYESGKKIFTFNNWNGEMTYAGSSVPPKWSASNGTSNLNGIFPQGAGLRLRSGSRSILPFVGFGPNIDGVVP